MSVFKSSLSLGWPEKSYIQSVWEPRVVRPRDRDKNKAEVKVPEFIPQKVSNFHWERAQGRDEGCLEASYS